MAVPRTIASSRCPERGGEPHRPNANPRTAAWCMDCGHRILIAPGRRDIEFEAAFVKNVAAEAWRRGGVNVDAYPRAVAERLEEGARRYSDTGFLAPDRDNLREMLEETPDVCVYALLTLERLQHDGTHVPDGVHYHLFEAAVMAALADQHARLARALLKEG